MLKGVLHCSLGQVTCYCLPSDHTSEPEKVVIRVYAAFIASILLHGGSLPSVAPVKNYADVARFCVPITVPIDLVSWHKD